MKKLFLATFIFFAAVDAYSQNGYPYISAGNDTILTCNDSCVTLHAAYQSAGSTDVYSVSQIPYTPYSYNTGTSIIVGLDDRWSAVIPIPFSFCFFGTAYNNIVVGSNGILTFDVTAANGFCNWALTSGATLPTTTFGLGITNSIMGAYQDIDPTYQGLICWSVSGNAPSRIVNVSFYQIPYFGDPNSVSNCCCPAMFATSQVILYETTNIIDINIENKDSCGGWNQGRAIEGIQNSTGTVAFAVPGRNNSAWIATNDAWRFTPVGSSGNVGITWFENSIQIGSGDSVMVCPDSATTYSVRATYTNCTGIPAYVYDYVTVYIPNALSISSVATGETCTSCNDGAVTVNVNSGNAPYTYSISPSAGTLNGNTFSNLPPGDYNVCVTDSAGCMQCDSVSIGVFTSIPKINSSNDIYFSANPFHSSTTLHLSSSFSKAKLKIFNVLGVEVKRQIIRGQTAVINREGMADGIYFFRVVNEAGESVGGKMVIE